MDGVFTSELHNNNNNNNNHTINNKNTKQRVHHHAVVWLNEKAEDFALYSELEKAFFRNHRKLDVSCIVERDLFGSHLEANANVNAASPEFKVGTLAAVAGAFHKSSSCRPSSMWLSSSSR